MDEREMTRHHLIDDLIEREKGEGGLCACDADRRNSSVDPIDEMDKIPLS